MTYPKGYEKPKTREEYFRSTWANINKGLALILLAIPISLLMFGIWNEFPNECGNGIEGCKYEEYQRYWKNPQVAELFWQMARIEITFLIVFAITMISYAWKYNDVEV